jgi:hypothetical protein
LTNLVPGSWISANFNMLNTHDNLGGTRPYTTHMNVPRYGLSVNPFYPVLKEGFLRNLTLDFLLSYNMRSSDDWARTVDKKYRSLSLSAIQRMGEFYLTLGQDEQRDLDFTFNGTSRRGHVTDLSLRWRPRGGILSFPLSPIVGVIPKEATAGALIAVGIMMCGVHVTKGSGIDLNNPEEAWPIVTTFIVMPLTYSITNGIGAGFIVYTLARLIQGKRDHVMMYVASAAFVVYFLMDFLKATFGI